MDNIYTDEYYMEMALEQAKLALELGEVPVGAVIVRDGNIIAKAYNRRETSKNALYHAELLAINEACKTLNGWRLPRCKMYVTLEPCPMCAGAIVNSRIEKVVYGAKDPKAGAVGSVYQINDFPLNHKFECVGGVCEDECRNLLQKFFEFLRIKQKEEKKSKENEGNCQ